MHNKDGINKADFPTARFGDAMREMSEKEFAALGAEKIAFRRMISAGDLSKFVPDAATMPKDLQFQMLMSADGSPILVTDSLDAVNNWLDDNEITLVTRH